MSEVKRSITSGFKQDMEELFSRFTTSKDCENSSEETKQEISLRFSRFCGIWCEMNFSYVFGLRLNDNHLRQFVDEMYSEVLPNVCEDNRFERRVCALYLLYSLFVKQPKIGGKPLNQKIRLTLESLKQIRELIQTCRQLDQLDVCYVWYKMLSLGAIDWVHSSRPMGFYYIRDLRVTDERHTETDFLLNEMKTLIDGPIDELSDIHQKYQTMKETLTEDNPPMEDLNQIKDNIFDISKDKMESLTKQFSSSSTTRPLPHRTDSQLNTGTEELIERNDKTICDIGDKRRKLKEKAFSFGAQTVTTNETIVDQKNNQIESQPKGRRRGRPKIAKLSQIID